MESCPLRGAGKCSGLFEHLAITFITSCIESAIGDGVLYGAATFVSVRAIGELAQVYVATQIAKEPGDFLWNDIPQLKLPDAGGVDDKAAHVQRNELCGGCGVFSFLRFAADRVHSQLQVGFNRVQQRRHPGELRN